MEAFIHSLPELLGVAGLIGTGVLVARMALRSMGAHVDTDRHADRMVMQIDRVIGSLDNVRDRLDRHIEEEKVEHLTIRSELQSLKMHVNGDKKSPGGMQHGMDH